LCGDMDCFAEPVIGRAFARPVARNDDLDSSVPPALRKPNAMFVFYNPSFEER
jgi:hypothetical protein